LKWHINLWIFKNIKIFRKKGHKEV